MIGSGAEAGVRWKFKWGLEFDLAYYIEGFLDTILLPPDILINPQAAGIPLDPDETDRSVVSSQVNTQVWAAWASRSDGSTWLRPYMARNSSRVCMGSRPSPRTYGGFASS